MEIGEGISQCTFTNMNNPTIKDDDGKYRVYAL
jgi:hypothetical protein